MKAKLQSRTPDVLAVLQRAATFGPGFKGQRAQPNESEHSGILQQLASFQLDTPTYLERPSEWVDRRAKLFEAGDFPDKGVTVTPEMLATLATNFDLPVPVLIEHSNSPLEIGFLTDVQVDGSQLFGTVSLTREANDLIDKSGAHALSLGLNSELNLIQEVSLVKKPRITSAKIFTGEVFAEEHDWKALYLNLIQSQVDQEVSQFVSQGRLVPSQVPFAKVLLNEFRNVEFDGDSAPISKIFRNFLMNCRGSEILHEISPQFDVKTPGVNSEARDFYQKHFPDHTLEEILSSQTQNK